MRRLFTITLTPFLLVCAAAATTPAEPIIALSLANRVSTFDSALPATVSVPRTITGLQPNETLVGIDRRPADGQLYGISDAGRVYLINPETGAATFVSIADAWGRLTIFTVD